MPCRLFGQSQLNQRFAVENHDDCLVCCNCYVDVVDVLDVAVVVD